MEDLRRIARVLLARMDLEAKDHQEFLGASYREELRAAIASAEASETRFEHLVESLESMNHNGQGWVALASVLDRVGEAKTIR